jgi:hypothetical protein
MRLALVLLALGLVGLSSTPAQARFDWRRLWDALGRGAAARVPEGRQAAVSGQYRHADDSVWVWRGPHATRTLVHELLHRATARRPQGFERALATLIGDLQINEGLTSYFADRALEQVHLAPTLAPPAPGSPFAVRRAWARTMRAQAADALQHTFGLEVKTDRVSVLSENSFRRVFERRSMEIWITPSDGPSYAQSQELVRQLVQLVGEEPLRRAYFGGDVEGLRQTLRQASTRVPRRSFPAGIDLDSRP